MVNQGQFPPGQFPQGQFPQGQFPQGQPPAPPQGNGIAVAGLVLGIIGLVFCWVPFFGWLLDVLGVIFGAIGVGKANRVGRGKGVAIAGLACGAIGLLLGIVLFVLALHAAHEAVVHSSYYGN